MKIILRLVVSAVLVSSLLVLPSSAHADGAYILLSNYSGRAGSSVNVSGEGFVPSESIEIFVGNGISPAATTTASTTGALDNVSVIIPVSSTPQIQIIIAARSASGLTANIAFYVEAFYPSILVSSNGNTPGSTINVSGSGFLPSETIKITMGDFVNIETHSDLWGEMIPTSFKLPTVSPGSYTINAVGQTSKGEAIAYFYLAAFYPNVFPSAYYLIPGQTISFNGGGFAPNENVSVFADSEKVSEFPVDNTGSYGNVGSYTIPANTPAGSLNFTLTGDTSLATVSAKISIGKFNPQVYPSTYFLRPGDIVSFSGINFAPFEAIRVFEGENPIGLNMVLADANGSFPENSLGFMIPASFASTKRTVKIVGDVSQIPVVLTIGVGKYTPQLSPSSYYIKAGEQISVDGWDFMPNENVDVTLQGNPAPALTANNTGNIKFGPVPVPFNFPNFILDFLGQGSGGEAHLNLPISPYFPTVTASEYYIQPGGKVSFYGGAFAPNEGVNVSVKLPTEASVPLGLVPTNKDGYLLDNSFSIPLDAIPGDQIYIFQGANSNSTTQVTVGVAAYNPLISSDNYYPAPGSNIRIWISGFGPNEVLNISVNGQNTTSVVADQYGSAGPISLMLPIKAKTAIISVDGVTSKVTKNLSLSLSSFNPVVLASTYYTLPGSTISFNGWGFAPNEHIAITQNGVAIGDAIANNLGEFETEEFTVPFDEGGTIEYAFVGEQSEQTNTVTLSLGQYNPYLLLSLYYGKSGDSETISGFSFAPNEHVDLTFGNLSLGSVITDPSGAFTFKTTIPTGSGKVGIIANGESSKTSAQTNFDYATY